MLVYLMHQATYEPSAMGSVHWTLARYMINCLCISLLRVNDASFRGWFDLVFSGGTKNVFSPTKLVFKH